jgi:hypothetical protein
MLGDVDGRATIFASESESLEDTDDEENYRCS